MRLPPRPVAIGNPGAPPSFRAEPPVEIVAPGVISTPASEIRIAISPDGRRALWGAIDRAGGPGGWDIFESTRNDSAPGSASTSPWGPAKAVSFDSKENDFDPAFAPDGLGVYFFSNRKGGLGGDDIYFVSLDPKTESYGTAVNLGPEINSPEDEWAPAVSPDGATLLFATDGRGGRGKHDLFVAEREGPRWVRARNLAELNTEKEDLDATFLPGGRSIVLTSGDLEGTVALYFAPFVDGRYGSPQLWGRRSTFRTSHRSDPRCARPSRACSTSTAGAQEAPEGRTSTGFDTPSAP